MAKSNFLGRVKRYYDWTIRNQASKSNKIGRRLNDYNGNAYISYVNV
ncbi:hypothetical protein ABFP60_13925 [Clostridioides difficile]